MKITVFGGSQAPEGSGAYTQAQTLGHMLARRDHTVLTGGYMGTMEAVSRGAAEAGGHVIGVTCEEIGRWHGHSANAWVSEEWKQRTLIQRLESLVRNADAAIALPGGPGTLAEVALMWNLMIVDSLPARPLILVGRAWNDVMDSFFANLGEYSPTAQRQLLQYASTIASAVDLLDNVAASGSGSASMRS